MISKRNLVILAAVLVVLVAISVLQKANHRARHVAHRPRRC